MFDLYRKISNWISENFALSVNRNNEKKSEPEPEQYEQLSQNDLSLIEEHSVQIAMSKEYYEIAEEKNYIFSSEDISEQPSLQDDNIIHYSDITDDTNKYIEYLEENHTSKLPEITLDDYSDGFDDYGVELLREYPKVQIDGNLSLREQAELVAIQLGDKYGWSEKKEIYLLADTFELYGHNKWNGAKKQIEEQLMSGLVYEELKLALEIRLEWDNLNRYDYLTWAVIVRLIRKFESYPDVEEVLFLIYKVHDYWLKNKSKLHKYFYQYLDEQVCNQSNIFEIQSMYY